MSIPFVKGPISLIVGWIMGGGGAKLGTLEGLCRVRLCTRHLPCSRTLRQSLMRYIAPSAA